MDGAILRAYGIDYRAGLARCMNDEAFYQKFLQLFLQDDSFQRAQAAYEAGDHRALFDHAHELKGACGNAAMTDLYAAVSLLVELLRDGAAVPQAEMERLFENVRTAYLRAREGVTLALAP